MKQLFNISAKHTFYIALGFLLLVNFSIAGCYILFTILSIQLIVHFARSAMNPQTPGSVPPSPSFRPPLFFKLFLLYVLFSLVSTIFSIDPATSLKDNREFFVFLLIPLFMLILDSPKRLDYSLSAVLVSAALSAFYGIIISIKEGISLDHRLKGFTSHWMTFAGLLMLTFIFFFVYMFYEKKLKRKLLIGALLLPILAAILLSLTRSVWVGIFVSLGIFIIYYKPKILYLVIPAGVLLAFFLPQSVMNRMTSIVDMQNETNKDRFYMYRTGIKIFKEHPLTGVGPDNIQHVYDRYKPAEATLSNPHLHNNFLHILAERGIFTFFALLAAFAAILVQLIRKIKASHRFAKAVSLGVLFAFIGFLVAGLFEYNFGDTEIKFSLFYFLSLPFVASWGLTAKEHQNQSQNESQNESQNKTQNSPPQNGPQSELQIGTAKG